MEPETRHLTLRFRTRKGTIDLPSVLIADRDHYAFNRIEILGDRTTYLDTLQLEWAQPDFASVQGDYGEDLISGQATMTSGHASLSGASITDKTVYKIAAFRISNITSLYAAAEGDIQNTLENTLILWPQPPWFPKPFLWYEADGSIKKTDSADSRWLSLSTEIQFRLSSTQWDRPTRTGDLGPQRFWMPKIELRGGKAPEAFEDACSDAWRWLKPLLSFYFRTEINLVGRFYSGPDKSYSRRWPRVLAPRSDNGHDRHFWKISPGAFCRASEAKAKRLSYDAGEIHAAVHNYLEGGQDSTLESQLLSFFEGIERVVHIFEVSHGYERAVLTKPVHGAFRKRLKRLIRSSPEIWDGMNAKERAAASSFLQINPNMNLFDRLKRMSARYRRWWGDYEIKAFSGIERTIKMRNDIVHGRMINEYDELVREKQRAKQVLEKLLLCLLGHPSLRTSYEESLLVNGEFDGRSISYNSF